MNQYNKFRINLNKDYFSLHNIIAILALFFIVLTSCGNNKKESTDKKETIDRLDPLFKSSIASTDIDFIKLSDPEAFTSLAYIGRQDREMPGSSSGELFDSNTYVFEASFTDNKKVEIWVHSSFGSENAAEEYAKKVTGPLGKLPALMRTTLDHVVLHKGDGTNSSEDEGGFIILYSDKIDTRILNNDLEETVFHESAHVAFDIRYVKNSDTWKQLQIKDNGNFVTIYGKNNPNREDLAETALFAYTMIEYPNRLSSEIQDWVKTNIPNRLAFFETIFQ